MVPVTNMRYVTIIITVIITIVKEKGKCEPTCSCWCNQNRAPPPFSPATHLASDPHISIHPYPRCGLGGDHDDDGHVRDWRWLLQEDSRPWLLPRKSVPAAVPHSWKREAPTPKFPRYQHHLTPRPILFRVVTSGKKELFDLKRRIRAKNTQGRGLWMGPSSLDDEMGSRGSREDKTQRTWRLTNSHTRLEGSVISSPNCTTPAHYHDKMTQ